MREVAEALKEEESYQQKLILMNGYNLKKNFKLLLRSIFPKYIIKAQIRIYLLWPTLLFGFLSKWTQAINIQRPGTTFANKYDVTFHKCYRLYVASDIKRSAFVYAEGESYRHHVWL